MSFSSIKALLAQYSPVSESSFSDAEKEAQIPLGQDKDLELSSNGDTPAPSSRPEKKSWVDARVISDAIIGLSDGMTVPFALTAGLSTLEDTKVVVFGGLAELIAGAISMGLGGYLGAKSEEESYRATLKQTREQTLSDFDVTTTIISDIFAPYDLPAQTVSDLTKHLVDSPHLPNFLMNFHHTLPEPSGSRAVTCALTIALGYFVGGFVPLVPYFFVGPEDAFSALKWSIAVMAVALFVFGYGKTCFVAGWKGRDNVKAGVYGGVQMVIVGGVAAGAAMGLVKLFQVLAR
ncbi:vacuolar iron transporter Ccc1, putative [Talaromyces stipitatus ATCC 10500]|uniref:Vacuolar iron transporter Ccc1, putative n=1 Tax=Talaromyces stipitatus (strain ATCC 10500 / CBS 375.48 / QM 6759 / NRRL 1006) TaxID=441959 RepID=B8LUR0_TALSN|nr:vacuolar iron transporter Ccc1, putative [Talaromyces stipitatus ATCC 10500]EED23917.1 vacuolar iron transporter Ccc1, putative [Talaromyces stipitatus ATCC 10500]